MLQRGESVAVVAVDEGGKIRRFLSPSIYPSTIVEHKFMPGTMRNQERHDKKLNY